MEAHKKLVLPKSSFDKKRANRLVQPIIEIHQPCGFYCIGTIVASLASPTTRRAARVGYAAGFGCRRVNARFCESSGVFARFFFAGARQTFSSSPLLRPPIAAASAVQISSRWGGTRRYFAGSFYVGALRAAVPTIIRDVFVRCRSSRRPTVLVPRAFS